MRNKSWLLILCLGLVTSVFSAPDNARQTADNYYAQKNYEQAIKYYQTAVKQSNTDEVAWFGLQNSYIQTGDFVAPQRLEIPALSERILWTQTRIFFYANRYDTLGSLIFELTRKFPKSDYINDALDLGIILASAGQDTIDLKTYSQAHYYYEILKLDNAVELCQSLITRPNPLAEYGYLLLAKIYLGKKAVNQAIGALNEFTAQYPKSRLMPKAKYELGTIYLLMLKDSITAKNVFEDLIIDYPESPESFFARSRLSLIKTDQKIK